MVACTKLGKKGPGEQGFWNMGNHKKGGIVSRLGLPEPTAMKFKSIALAYTVYHALKLGHREVVEHALASRHFEDLAALSKQLAVTHNRILARMVPQ